MWFRWRVRRRASLDRYDVIQRHAKAACELRERHAAVPAARIGRKHRHDVTGHKRLSAFPVALDIELKVADVLAPAWSREASVHENLGAEWYALGGAKSSTANRYDTGIQPGNSRRAFNPWDERPGPSVHGSLSCWKAASCRRIDWTSRGQQIDTIATANQLLWPQ